MAEFKADAIARLEAENARLAEDLRSSTRENERLAGELLDLKSTVKEPETVDDRKATKELARLRNYLFRDWPGKVQEHGESSGAVDIALRILRRAVDMERELDQARAQLSICKADYQALAELDQLKKDRQRSNPVAEAVTLAKELEASEREATELREKARLERARNEDLTGDLAHLEEVNRASVDENRAFAKNLEACRKERARFAADLDELGNYLLAEWSEERNPAKSPGENAVELLVRMRAIVDQLDQGEGKKGLERARRLQGEDRLAWAEEEVSKLSKYLLDEQAKLVDDRKSPAENAIELLRRGKASDDELGDMLVRLKKITEALGLTVKLELKTSSETPGE
jgi:hypothetical protein